MEATCKSRSELPILMKRAFDILFSGLGLLIAAPLFIVVSVLIKVTSPGPVFYRAERVGLHGRPFRLFKFRSMTVGADQKGFLNVPDWDPRITPIGSFLRKTKLDELPQLISVFIGDMSFVGPRPELKCYTDMYTEEQKAILTLKPGITDWASLIHFDQHIDFTLASNPDEAYLRYIRPTKIELQLLYSRNHSFAQDLKILYFTVLRTLFQMSVCPSEIEPYIGKRHRARKGTGTE